MNESSKTKKQKTQDVQGQRRMEIELTNKSLRAFGSQADELESIGSRHNLERTEGWTKSVAQQPGPSRPLSPNVVINPPKNVK